MKIIKFTLLAVALIISINMFHSVVSAKTKKPLITKKTERKIGVVKWFSDAKGYGFITPEKGEDLFVHFRAIMGSGFKTLKSGQKVSYKAVNGQKGQQADEVQAL